MKKSLIVFILGPTGCGKSEFAAALAKKLKGEVISCDSMQVYKGMAILTQQPGPQLRKVVRHHLVGTVSPSKEWSAADFVKAASKAAQAIIKRKKLPIFAGGTGLYARSFTQGLFKSPPKDEALRERLRAYAGRYGSKKLHEMLAAADPVYASKIHHNDIRRVIRALEVYRITGRPISEHHAGTFGASDKYEWITFMLNRPRQELYDRINSRVEDMFREGVAAEIKKLKDIKISRTAGAALGYKEINDYLDGRISAGEAKELIKKKTRHYAKGQLTWFRKEKDAVWLEIKSDKQEKKLIDKVAKIIEHSM